MTKLTGGGFPFQIDDEDVHWLKKYPVLSRDMRGYIICRESWDTSPKVLHRLIMNCPSHLVVDHINHNKADNRRANLRVCTRAENNQNIKKTNKTSHTSQYKGVKWHPTDKCWHAQIQVNKKLIWLGMCEEELQAAELYDDAAKHFFKQFAFLNFPEREPRPYQPRTPLKQHSQHKGISFDKTKRSNPWAACIQQDGQRWQQRFETEEAAIAALQTVRQDLASGKPLPEGPKKAAPKYSQHPGITKDIRKTSSPWKAKIKSKGKILWQGNFPTEAEAVQALEAKRMELAAIAN